MSNTPILNALDERAMLVEGAELVDDAHTGSAELMAASETPAVFEQVDDGTDEETGEPLERLDVEARTDSDG